MRFQVAHLLALMGFIAVFGAALVNPSDSWLTAVMMGSWCVYSILVCRAIVCVNQRAVLCCSLVFGLSYLGMFVTLSDWFPITGLLRELSRSLGRRPNSSYEYSFVIIGQLGLSFLWSLLGGVLGAYYSKSKTET